MIYLCSLCSFMFIMPKALALLSESKEKETAGLKLIRLPLSALLSAFGFHGDLIARTL